MPKSEICRRSAMTMLGRLARQTTCSVLVRQKYRPICWCWNGKLKACRCVNKPIRLFFLVTLSSMTWSQTRNACTLGLMISDIIPILRESHRLSKGYAFPWAREMGRPGGWLADCRVPPAAFDHITEHRQTGAKAAIMRADRHHFALVGMKMCGRKSDFPSVEQIHLDHRAAGCPFGNGDRERIIEGWVRRRGHSHCKSTRPDGRELVASQMADAPPRLVVEIHRQPQR